MSTILLSGGLDSAVLLAYETKRNGPQNCVAFNYGQKHAIELEHSYKIASFYRAHWARIDLPSIAFVGSCLTGQGEIPHGHFEDPMQKTTVVPNRNMVFLSIAATVAIQYNDPTVLFAAHAGDAAIYHDCRSEFVESLSKSMWLGCGVRISAPFLFKTKRDIVTLGKSLNVPFEMTWSCYEGRDQPCGKCGACIEREWALS